MNPRIRFLLAAASAAAALVLAAWPAAAHAGEDNNHHPAPRPGVACPAGMVGQTAQLQTHDNGLQTYRCEQREDDPCPVWHWVYNPDVPAGQTPARACPECPSPPLGLPPGTPSATPSSTPTTAPPAATPRDDVPTLPRTDDTPWALAGGGALVVVLGIGLRVAGRRRST